MESRPRSILYIVTVWPGAPEFGGQQRVLQIGRLLQKQGRVSLVVLDVDNECDQWYSATAKEFTIAEVVKVTATSHNGFRERLRHELDPSYIDTGRKTISSADQRIIRELVDQHDVVWIHTIKAADLLGIYQWPKSVLDIDNLPSQLYDSSGRMAVRGWRKVLDWRMSLIWRRREGRWADRFSVLTVCSENDRRYLNSQSLYVLPNGFRKIPPSSPSAIRTPRIGFIGTFKWEPNVEGVRWFCAEVWPRVKQELPDARLRIVGEGTQVARDWGVDVDAMGRVEDAGPEIDTWMTMIVPIRIGGGTRIKLLEGFARRCPVVATHLGAFGYGIKDGEEAFLTDAPAQFAARCVELIKSPQVHKSIADRAYRRFLDCWTWESYEGIVRSAVELAMSKGIRNKVPS